MERSRRDVLLSGLALAACSGAPPPVMEPRPTGADPRNVIVILTDDQRWNSFSFLGHPFVKTPHLDRVARDGAVCSEAFVTTSLCCPSRASMFTGLYAHTHGILDNSGELDPAFPTYARILERAGIDTAYIGKWHMGAGNPHPRPGWKHWVGFRGQGKYLYPGTDNDPLDRGFSYDGSFREVEGYVTDLLTDEAVSYLESRDGKTPFCMVLAHKGVHAPFTPAERHKGLYADEARIPAVLPDTDAAYAELPAWLREMRRSSDFGVERPYDTWPDFRSWYLDYHRTLLAIDDGVGRILATLEARGLLDRTAVLFTSDNGFMFGEKGVLDKRNFYEPSIRVPMLGVAPGLIPAGTKVDRFVLNVDLAPTILELCGYHAPEQWHGRSIVPLLRGEKLGDEWRQEFVYEYFYERMFPETPTLFGIRTKRMKLSTTFGAPLPDELFDLQADPEEKHNLADLPDEAERHKSLKTRMGKHFMELGMLQEPVWGRNWITDPLHAAESAGSE